MMWISRRCRRYFLVVVGAWTLVCFSVVVGLRSSQDRSRRLTESYVTNLPQEERAYAYLPMTFEANRGQADAQVKFLSHGRGYDFFLTSTDAVWTMPKSTLRMKALGSSAHPSLEGLDKLAGTSNYFLGTDPTQWRTNVPMYAKVRSKSVFPGIDIVYYGNGRQLEY